MSYERLFSPGKIGGCEIKNRIIMAPYNKNYNARDGSITQRQIDYFVDSIKNGRLENVNSFASALQTDVLIDLLTNDAAGRNA